MPPWSSPKLDQGALGRPNKLIESYLLKDSISQKSFYLVYIYG